MVISFLCTNCKKKTNKSYKKHTDIPDEIECPKCKAISERLLGLVKSHSKIVVDDGISARSVEFFPDIEELNVEREKIYNEELGYGPEDPDKIDEEPEECSD